MKPDAPTVRDWEKEFDNSMRDGQHPFVWPNGNTNWDGIKSFIRTERAAAKAEGYEKALQEILSYMNAEVRDGIEDKELVKSWIRFVGNKAMEAAARSLTDGV